jgi:hypothetical protein
LFTVKANDVIMYFFVEFCEWPMLSNMQLMYGSQQNFVEDAGFQPGRLIYLDYNTERFLYLFLGGDSQMVHLRENFRGGIITDRADRTFFIAARFLNPLLEQLDDDDRSTAVGEDMEGVPDGVEAANLSWPQLTWNMQPEE